MENESEQIFLWLNSFAAFYFETKLLLEILLSKNDAYIMMNT